MTDKFKGFIFLLLGCALGLACRRTVEDRTGIEFVKIPAGTFEMGDTFGDGDSDEQPVFNTKIKGYELSKTEVTVRQFRRFVEATGYRTDAENDGQGWAWTEGGFDRIAGASWRNPGFPQQENHPVVNVSWRDATAFCDWAGCRLPTEAEWEYAARDGGKKIRYSWGNERPGPDRGGNVADETGCQVLKFKVYFKGYTDGFVFSAPVASFAANGLGVYDLTGNVWEWCQDQYEEFIGPLPPHGKEFNPAPMSLSRVLRGGSYDDDPNFCRCSDRSGQDPAFAFPYIGFRVAR